MPIHLMSSLTPYAAPTQHVESATGMGIQVKAGCWPWKCLKHLVQKGEILHSASQQHLSRLERGYLHSVLMGSTKALVAPNTL